MPKLVALGGCAVLVLLLLRSERRGNAGVSAAVWIPTIWMVSIASKPLAYWFGIGGVTSEGSPVDRAFLMGLLVLAVLVLAMRKIDWDKAIRANPWLTVLLCYMLVGILWSHFPAASFKRWIREATAIIMALLLFSELDAKEAVESVLRRSVYILVPFSLLLIKYFPEYGVEFGRWSGARMWIGVTTQKNGLGRLCLTAVFFLMWSLVKARQMPQSRVKKQRTRADGAVLAVSLYLLAGGLSSAAYSATAIAACTAGTALFWTLVWMRKSRVRIGAGLLGAVIVGLLGYGLASLFLNGSNIGGVTSILGRDKSLTGRTDVWASLLPAAMHRPLFGSGVGGFWNQSSRGFYQISEAHSGYLDVILEMGFVGLAIICGFLVSSGRKAVGSLSHDFYWGTLWICYLVMVVIHNATETSFNTLTSQMMATLLFVVVASTASVDDGRAITTNAKRLPSLARPRVRLSIGADQPQSGPQSKENRG
jgi:exopolysaccharide production protein ExoQ